jgi:hypothetical protein
MAVQISSLVMPIGLNVTITPPPPREIHFAHAAQPMPRRGNRDNKASQERTSRKGLVLHAEIW